MKVVTALDAGLFGFGGFKTAVSRIDITFENDFSVSNGQCVHGARFNQPDRKTLHRSSHTEFVAALRQNYIIET